MGYEPDPRRFRNVDPSKLVLPTSMPLRSRVRRRMDSGALLLGLKEAIDIICDVMEGHIKKSSSVEIDISLIAKDMSVIKHHIIPLLMEELDQSISRGSTVSFQIGQIVFDNGCRITFHPVSSASDLLHRIIGRRIDLVVAHRLWEIDGYRISDIINSIKASLRYSVLDELDYKFLITV